MDEDVRRSERFIVCGVDGSDGARNALSWALAEASRRGCSLHAVTAWMWDGVEDLGTPTSPSVAKEQAQEIQEATILAATEGIEDPPVIERLLPRQTASEALCQESEGADLLVLGSHGHGLVHDKLVGSTSQRTIHHAPCPVVVIPDPRQAERRRSHVWPWRRTSSTQDAGKTADAH